MKKHKIIPIAVIGDPISQSLSPKMHNFLLKKYQIDGYYVPIRLDKENLLQAVKNLIKIGFKGFNITIPHKENIIDLCHKLSNSAKEIGAVNTIKIMDDGVIFGHNSDGIGFIKNLQNKYPDFDFNDINVALIGAGGSARAIIHALIKQNVKKITIFNRNMQRAENLVKNIDRNIIIDIKNLSEINSTDKNEQKYDLLINSTSLGMENNSKLDINLDPKINHNINPDMIIYDIIYKPLITPLLQQAKDNNLRIVTGIGMLIFQGLVGFEMWFGKRDFMEKEIENILL